MPDLDATLTVDDVNRIFPPARVRQNSEQFSSDEGFVNMVLNGFNPQILKYRKGEYFSRFTWAGIEQSSSPVFYAPDTTAYFSMESDRLKVTRIEVAKRVDNNAAANAAYHEPIVYRPGDPLWERAKRMYRVNYFLFGEATTHLAATHLNMEQYNLAVMRNLKANPVLRLLDPHFDGTIHINNLANGTLLADTVPDLSATTVKSLNEVVKLGFGGYNWANWRPRKPLSKYNHYAEVANIHWSAVTEYVDWFFDRSIAEIRDYWGEIHAMSKELVANSVQYVDPGTSQWTDTNELNTNDKKHPKIGGIVRAISPVTESDSPPQNGNDIENLKQMCRYIIHVSTFEHSWVNDQQYHFMGGDVEYASLGLRVDLTDPNVDEEAAVTANDAALHYAVTWLLSQVRYGYLTVNEDSRINRKFVEILNDKKEQYARFGLEVSSIRSSIYI